MCVCVERTSNKSQHPKLTLTKKFSRRSCRDSNSQPFDHESGALTNKLPLLPSHVEGQDKVMLNEKQDATTLSTSRTQ